MIVKKLLMLVKKKEKIKWEDKLCYRQQEKKLKLKLKLKQQQQQPNDTHS